MTPFTCILFPSIYVLHSIRGIKNVNPPRPPIPIPNTKTKALLTYNLHVKVGK